MADTSRAPVSTTSSTSNSTPTSSSTAVSAAAKVREVGAIAIIRGTFSTAQLLASARVLVDEGLSVMEVTLNSPGALDAIANLRAELGDSALIGAGTCRNESEVRAALAGGAQFTVAPNLDLDSVRLAAASDRLHLPGVFTGSEIANAIAHGSRMLKLFPCDTQGPKLVRAMLAPFDELDLIAVGGVDAGNIAEFIAAGAAAVGLGSSLTRHFDDPAALRREAAMVRSGLAEARGNLGMA